MTLREAVDYHSFAAIGDVNCPGILICRGQGEVGGTVASDWVTNLDRYGDPVLPWSRAHNLLASGPKGPRSTHRAICDILGMSAGKCAGACSD
jgi:hypothetical protein